MPESEFQTKSDELMEFAQDVTAYLYYMGQTEIIGCFPVEGKQFTLHITLKEEKRTATAVEPEQNP